MKLNIHAVITALEDSIKSHEKEGGYEWTVAEMRQTLDLLETLKGPIIIKNGKVSSK